MEERLVIFDMKAYTWYGVLYDYGSGSVTAVAGSVDEARRLIVDKWSCGAPLRLLPGAVQDDIKVVMNKDPAVADLPCVVEYRGSA
jgi:hypothetical protein